MNLDEEKKRKVSAWITEGLKLSDIQKRLETEFGLRPTYLEVRLLVDDLKLVPKDILPPPEKKNLNQPPAAPLEKEDLAAVPSGVSVTVDTVARPGAMISGSVRFTDGKSAGWYIDQMGRLGIVPSEPGYKPPAADLQAFQKELDTELRKFGY